VAGHVPHRTRAGDADQDDGKKEELEEAHAAIISR
jgi:hypothetical protein